MDTVTYVGTEEAGVSAHDTILGVSIIRLEVLSADAV